MDFSSFLKWQASSKLPEFSVVHMLIWRYIQSAIPEHSKVSLSTNVMHYVAKLMKISFNLHKKKKKKKKTIEPSFVSVRCWVSRVLWRWVAQCYFSVVIKPNSIETITRPHSPAVHYTYLLVCEQRRFIRCRFGKVGHHRGNGNLALFICQPTSRLR